MTPVDTTSATTTARDYGACLHRSCADVCRARAPGIDVAMSRFCYDCTVSRCGDPLGEGGDGGALDSCINSSLCRGACVDTPDWDCVGHVEWPKPLSVPTLPLSYEFVASDFVNSGTILSGGMVTACSGIAADCTPVAPTCTTASDGRCKIQFDEWNLFNRFSLLDYWQLTDVPGFLPSLNYLIPPPVTSSSDRQRIPPSNFYDGLGGDLAHSGVVGIRQLDCAMRAAAGLTLEVIRVTPPSKPPTYVYFSGFQPQPSAKETDSYGYAVAINVEPGTVTVRTRLPAKDLIVSELPVTVRTGFITGLAILPTKLDK